MFKSLAKIAGFTHHHNGLWLPPGVRFMSRRRCCCDGETPPDGLCTICSPDRTPLTLLGTISGFSNTIRCSECGVLNGSFEFSQIGGIGSCEYIHTWSTICGWSVTYIKLRLFDISGVKYISGVWDFYPQEDAGFSAASFDHCNDIDVTLTAVCPRYFDCGSEGSTISLRVRSV
jgi:hypothetical protein